jgi:hypothetical protein
MTRDASSDDSVRIAYATARFPPMTSSGTRRVEAMQRYLPQYGIEPVFVTTSAGEVAEGPVPHEVTASETSVLRYQTPVVDRMLHVLSSVPYVRWGLRELLSPDTLRVWASYSARKARRHIDSVHAVMATGPPFSAHVAAEKLARSQGVPCIQEFRDPPSFHRGVHARSALTRWRRGRFEARRLRRADHVIVVTAGVRRRLLRRYPWLAPEKVSVIENGAPELVPDTSLSGRGNRVFTASFVGSHPSHSSGGPSKGSPEWFAAAVTRFRRPIEFRVVGPLTGAQQDRLRSVGGERTAVVGAVDRREAIAEVAAADVVVVTGSEQDEWWVGRKVYEAARYAQRVLAIVPPHGDTAALLESLDHAEVVAPGDEQGLDAAMLRSWSEWREGRSAPASAGRERVQTDQSCAKQVAELAREVADRCRWRSHDRSRCDRRSS